MLGNVGLSEMKSEKTAKGYQPTAGIETQVSVGNVIQADRDAFWLSTLIARGRKPTEEELERCKKRARELGLI